MDLLAQLSQETQIAHWGSKMSIITSFVSTMSGKLITQTGKEQGGGAQVGDKLLSVGVSLRGQV